MCYNSLYGDHVLEMIREVVRGYGVGGLFLDCMYARTLGRPVLNMTGRFHEAWGDFGGIRTEASLEYDCLYGLANAMRATIGDHFHPRGDVNRAVFDLVKRIYGRLRKLEPWLEGAKALAEVAVVAPAPGFRTAHPEAHHRSVVAVQGAVRMLCELKAQFDVLSDRGDWSGYRVLILPDHVVLDEAAAEKVRAHLAAGGAVIASAWSGLDPEKRGYVLPEWGVRFQGDDPLDPAYYRATSPVLGESLPDMAHNCYGRGVMIESAADAETLAEIVQPFFSHAAFTAYAEYASVPLRQAVAALLRGFLPSPMARAPALPSFARLTVTEQPGRRMAHVLAYAPERRGAKIDMIEEPIELRDVELCLRVDGRPPRRVYTAPDRTALPWESAGDYIRTTVPRVPGCAMVVFEE